MLICTFEGRKALLHPNVVEHLEMSRKKPGTILEFKAENNSERIKASDIGRKKRKIMGGTVSVTERDIQNNRLSGNADYMTGFCYVNCEANDLGCCIKLVYS